MSLIEVKGLRKSFGSLDVLKGIDLTVEQGEQVFRAMVADMKKGIKLD